MRLVKSAWGWGLGAVLLLALVFILAQRGGGRQAGGETTVSSNQLPPAKPHHAKPKPKPRKIKPRVIIKRPSPVVKTSIVVETTPAPPPRTVTVTKTVTTTAPTKPVQLVKPKPKPKPARPKVIAPFVWVIAFVASPGGQPQTVRLREYDGKDIVNVKVLKSGTTYRYRYKHEADQLCQVIKPGTTATSPVCVQIRGKSQVITFTNTQV